MKKSALLILAAAPLFLISCGKGERNPEDYIFEENFTVYESTTLPISRMFGDDPQVETTTVETRNISYIINNKEVIFLVDGRAVKTLVLTYVPEDKNIIVEDFNFDGYDDIFVPYENYGSSIIYGDYYCYVPFENGFTKNSELAKVGKMLTIGQNETLTEKLDDEFAERMVEYKWTNGKLNPFRKTETYTSYEDGQIHKNIYGYTDDGTEYLELST